MVFAMETSLKMDDDWGYPYLRKPIAGWMVYFMEDFIKMNENIKDWENIWDNIWDNGDCSLRPIYGIIWGF